MDLILYAIFGIVAGLVGGFFVHRTLSAKKEDGAVSRAEKLLQEATEKAERSSKELMAETKEEIHQIGRAHV